MGKRQGFPMVCLEFPSSRQIRVDCLQGWAGYKELRELLGVPDKSVQNPHPQYRGCRCSMCMGSYVAYFWDLNPELYRRVLTSNSLLSSEMYAVLPPLDIIDLLGD